MSVPSNPGLQGKWLNHCTTQASKWHQILRHYDGASLNNQVNSTIQQMLKLSETCQKDQQNPRHEMVGSDYRKCWVRFFFFFLTINNSRVGDLRQSRSG